MMLLYSECSKKCYEYDTPFFPPAWLVNFVEKLETTTIHTLSMCLFSVTYNFLLFYFLYKIFI